MSRKHPIISITGSSGAGTTSVKRTFEQIFHREGVKAVYLEGDAFHRYDRAEMRVQMAKEAERGNKHFSHFSPETNLFEELERAFRDYGETGTAVTRHYVHDTEEAGLHGTAPGTFTEWKQLPENSDLLFYEGLHGAVVTDKINVARYADLKIGVVPVINLEWIQKLHRDRSARGYSTEAVTDTILRRMPDYIHYICPQFTETDINFQRPEQREPLLLVCVEQLSYAEVAEVMRIPMGTVMSRVCRARAALRQFLDGGAPAASAATTLRRVV